MHLLLFLSVRLLHQFFSHFLHFFVCLERLNLRMADGDIHHQLIAIAVIVGAAVVVVVPSILTIVVCVAY